MDLASTPWPDVARDALTVAVPVGSFEQHGPHLPLDTDTRIASAVTRSLTDVVAAPAIEYGASGEHEGFPGTVSIGSGALETLLVEYGRSVCRWARRVVFVNGHGGNGPALVKAVELLRYEGRDVAWLPCAIPGADAHAGRTETSLLLHLSPRDVAMDRAESGNTAPIVELMPQLRSGGMLAATPNGILGDPAGASAEEGERLFADLVRRADEAIEGWSLRPDGRLV
ncbi:MULTISPECIES: mycofactocin biosynthesis peptidyl-dipeptidase MftE [unclassified Rhodococcus (in: high G+C Gram-positive bacteria)]|uniref:mycofactocin biosynthesis peptidyl-dipeptidase MftE n=1 Tax=unclassified Rhodococcus (in: high G+C Gram-positive bacteria) TaxID=192944 RepID=UPI000E0BA540|nr:MULTISPECIES: mycofactocin biosynthesis peptidyl-dipeptidase MftE [unclassified Rhodococcus (in: high G+C Gram-positive bacteria)]QKT12817.1 mycofactocin biosynthesis peptidyl-dipeptidase MftE [Rhodococcus sp. W8901]RDI33923.1 creatinine amidohydrolase [Rhodococcus sp. AG1013]